MTNEEKNELKEKIEIEIQKLQKQINDLKKK